MFGLFVHLSISLLGSGDSVTAFWTYLTCYCISTILSTALSCLANFWLSKIAQRIYSKIAPWANLIAFFNL